MKRCIFITILALTGMASCSSHEELASTTSTKLDKEMASSPPVPIATAKMLVDNNSFIDVDMEAHDRVTVENYNPKIPGSYKIAAELYPEEEALSRAALYRYYSKLSIIDGQWICSAKKASDLNMSERTFNYMNDNINNLNEQAKQAREEGMTVRMPEITAEYLRSLIEY